MLDSLLISQIDFKPYADINSNIVASKKLDPYILQAQLMDLRPILGEEMYWDFMADFEASPKLAKYNAIYEGSVYQDRRGNNIKQEGLIPVMCYFAYSRYVLNKQANDTAYAIVNKTNDYSTPVEYKVIQGMSNNARTLANDYMRGVIRFLNHNYKDYPLWRSGCGRGNIKRSIIISAVGR